MADGATIDPASLTILYGPHLIQGRAAGQFLNVSFSRDTYTMGVGVDGEGFWVKSANLSATMTVTLVQSSDSNDVLSAMFIADQMAAGGALLGWEARESNGRTVYKAERARISRWADGIWSDGAEVRTWVFTTTRMLAWVGGVGPTPFNASPIAGYPWDGDPQPP